MSFFSCIVRHARFLFVVLAIMTACKKDDPAPNTNPSQTPNQTPTTTVPSPTVTSFQPTIGLPGSVVTVTGTNFGTSPTVTVNGITATVLAGSTDTSLKIKTAFTSTTGKISVTAGSNTATSSADFYVVLSDITQGGGTGNEVPIASTFDTGGNFYVTGTFKGATTFGNKTLTSVGAEDIFVLKYDFLGNLIWAVSAGTAGTDGVVGIAGDAEVYICGNFSGTAKFGTTTLTSNGGTDAYLAIFNGDGTVYGASQVGGPGNDNATAIAMANGGSRVMMAGTFEQSVTQGPITLTAGAAQADAYLLYTNKIGSVYWFKSISGAGKETINAMVSPTDATYLVGTYDQNITMGSSSLTTSGGSNAFAFKLDLNGNPLWSQRFTSTGSFLPVSIVRSFSGQVYIGGTFSQAATIGSATLTSAGKLDMFISRLNSSDGSTAWAKRAGGVEDDILKGLAVDQMDANGRVYFTGSFTDQLDFDGVTMTPEVAGQKNVVVGRYSSGGNMQWTGQNGSGGVIEGVAISIYNTRLWAVSSFASSPTLCGKSVTSRGEQDVLFWRLTDFLLN